MGDIFYGTDPFTTAPAPSEAVQAVFGTDKGARWAGGVATPRFNEVFKGLYTNDVAYRNVQVNLFTRLREISPPPGFTFDPSLVLNVQAYMGSPSGTPPVDAMTRALEKVAEGPAPAPAVAAARTSYVRTRRYDTPGLQRVEEVFRRCLAFVDWGPVPVKVESTTAVPHFTTDMGPKIDAVRDWMTNASAYSKAFTEGRFKWLASNGIVFTYAAGYRSQVEGVDVSSGVAKPKKIRNVFTWENEWHDVDRTYEAPRGSKYASESDKFVLRTRPRQLSMSPFKASLPARCAAKAIERGLYLGPAGRVFHHHGLPDIERKVSGCVGYGCYDVGNHDQNIPSVHIEALVGRVAALIGPVIAEMVELLHRCPLVARNDYTFGRGVIMRGNPLDPWEANLYYGNPSGSPFTSIVAKAVGHFYFVDAAARFAEANRLQYDLEALVEGTHPGVKALNLGDNILAVAFEERWLPFVHDVGAWAPFALVEAATEFSGYTLVGNGLGVPQFQPNIMAMVHKTICPDRTHDSPHRGSPRIGYAARITQYSTNVMFRAFFAAMNAALRDETSLDWEGWAMRSPVPLEVVGVNLATLTSQELEALLDPSVMDWKYSPDEVPGVSFAHYFNVDKSEAARLVAAVERR